ncbi:GNAT family N-acetyltransferase [Glaciecola sp. 1036]|uniref:GNAT family N-acetyltransferase n=1 Tax=Alteromonadaceae TaxID=72275 RepID=UPI003D016360
MNITALTSYNASEVANLIKTIQGSSDNIFLSRSWFESWLNCISNQPECVIFKDADIVKGIAFIGNKKGFWGTTYFLNQQGLTENDQMWIENNDILAEEDSLVECRQHFLAWLLQQSRFFKLTVSMSTSDAWYNEQLFQWSKIEEPVNFIDLAKLRSESSTHIQALSKNTRASIRRALKYIEQKFGSITLIRHKENCAQILQDKVAPMHIKQWQPKGIESGFTNPIFCKFHQSICSQTSDQIKPEILEFRLDNAQYPILGYLYFLNSTTTCNFYLSAIDYFDSDNKFNPGLVMHNLAADYFLSQGYDKYDFLGGEARYKTSLSNASYKMYSVELVKNSLVNRMLYTANKIRHALIANIGK